MLYKKFVLSLGLFFVLGYAYSLVFADTVVLKTGQKVEGKIIENTDKYVKLDFDGVELIYFQNEISSINQIGTEKAAKKELAAFIEAFNPSDKVVGNTNQIFEPKELVPPMIDQKAQDTLNTAAVLSPQEKVSVNSPDAVQAAFSQIPKEYQGMVKSSLQSLSSPGGTGQALSVTSGELSSLPPEYRNLIQASLDKMPLSTSKPEEKN